MQYTKCGYENGAEDFFVVYFGVCGGSGVFGSGGYGFGGEDVKDQGVCWVAKCIDFNWYRGRSLCWWADKNGWGSCGTPVGKQRANQLAKGEPISIDTIKRMYSFVSRHEKDLESSKSYGDGCGKLMMDAWGGLAAGRWAHNKLKQLGLLQENEGNPSFPGGSYAGEPADGYVSPAVIGGRRKMRKKLFK